MGSTEKVFGIGSLALCTILATGAYAQTSSTVPSGTPPAASGTTGSASDPTAPTTSPGSAAAGSY